MFMKISKFAAPVAGAVLLAAAGLASTSASAAPLGGDLNAKSASSALVIEVGHKNHGGGHHGGGKHGGGFHKGHGKHFQAFGPREIRRSLRHRGYQHIQIVDRRGPMYIVNARGWRGAPTRLVVDSRNARIVREHRLGNQFHWQFNF